MSVSGQCSLAFTGQPAETAVNSDILTGFNSTGSPLAVQLLDANNDPLNPANFSANGTPVTVSILTNPAGGTLTGTTTVASSNGVADFGNLQINNPGAAYDLAANASPGFTPATSTFFTVTGQIQACGTGSCSASQSTSTTAASVTTSSAAGDFVTLGLGGVTFTCNHYNAVSDVAAFGVFDSSGGSVTSSSAIVTLTVSPSEVESAQRPLLLWQLCYASQTPFPAIPGTSGTTVIGSTTYYTGLLLPCFLFSPESSGALPHLPAADEGRRGHADLCRSRGSLRAWVTMFGTSARPPVTARSTVSPSLLIGRSHNGRRGTADLSLGRAALPGLRRGEP